MTSTLKATGHSIVNFTLTPIEGSEPLLPGPREIYELQASFSDEEKASQALNVLSKSEPNQTRLEVNIHSAYDSGCFMNAYTPFEHVFDPMRPLRETIIYSDQKNIVINFFNWNAKEVGVDVKGQVRQVPSSFYKDRPSSFPFWLTTEKITVPRHGTQGHVLLMPKWLAGWFTAIYASAWDGKSINEHVAITVDGIRLTELRHDLHEPIVLEPKNRSQLVRFESRDEQNCAVTVTLAGVARRLK